MHYFLDLSMNRAMIVTINVVYIIIKDNDSNIVILSPPIFEDWANHLYQLSLYVLYRIAIEITMSM